MQFDLFDSTSNQILEAKTYQAFKQALIASNCQKCPLSQGRQHIVIDRGNSQAATLLIGEAPGENEDKQGRAFVGRAGQLMDQMMLEAGIDTNQDTLIANIIKCRPPENRAPKQEEVDQCLPFLRKQIALLNPTVIGLLGATSLKHMISGKPQTGMAEAVGKPFTHPHFPQVQLIVLYHPAYILRDPRKKPLMAEHLKVLKQLIDEHSNQR
ncbi:MAG: uracil-DNA glycosylase [Candidatus Omnitrophica bacterium CG11_big_fil_rev_8_21_14_0_20_45_26]|uniref:Type-4 uracil-DNA glycosylase n=1 Tax=Candidatus Abzuiibacterium crystallinum TaxID=1974748 RepID=A0A2H0LPD7_9BACT|nr:MAG: uracil-DNA glycosylase [Candidatus Omnitrophica bacterium CG11_big_fil_rev_8_21_14_0_20_45_26]PIW63734.1 MAG: uracil-DNA glycosylase [Candidatus Omnitrophica bacterium CG12_big_fil_rev_8_21_14_0_65_45_16]